MSDLMNEAGAVITPRQRISSGSKRMTGKVWYELFKRCLDRLGAGLGMLLLSPFFALVAILIKLESPGPVLFSQTRIGLGGQPFRCWKLRSMYIDAEQRKEELLEQN